MGSEIDTPADPAAFRLLSPAEFEKLSLDERMVYLRKAVDALRTARRLSAVKRALQAMGQPVARRTTSRGR